jgi:hypothetical protein
MYICTGHIKHRLNDLNGTKLGAAVDNCRGSLLDYLALFTQNDVVIEYLVLIRGGM